MSHKQETFFVAVPFKVSKGDIIECEDCFTHALTIGEVVQICYDQVKFDSCTGPFYLAEVSVQNLLEAIFGNCEGKLICHTNLGEILQYT